MFVHGVGFGVWMGIGCPCPPVRNDIVTPRHLFYANTESPTSTDNARLDKLETGQCDQNEMFGNTVRWINHRAIKAVP